MWEGGRHRLYILFRQVDFDKFSSLGSKNIVDQHFVWLETIFNNVQFVRDVSIFVKFC